jgi:hypothetical protein
MKYPYRRQFLHLAASAAALSVVSRIARAQAYPTRPVQGIERTLSLRRNIKGGARDCSVQKHS